MDPTQQGLQLFALWLLIFVRFAGFVVQAPIWGSHHFDKKILVASVAVWSCIVYPSMTVPNISFEPITYILMVALQLLVGLIIGYASFMIMSAAQFAGEMLDTQMGLSVAASYDPASGSSVNMMRRLKFYLAMTLFLIFDGHHKLLETVFRSFDEFSNLLFRSAISFSSNGSTLHNSNRSWYVGKGCSTNECIYA